MRDKKREKRRELNRSTDFRSSVERHKKQYNFGREDEKKEKEI